MENDPTVTAPSDFLHIHVPLPHSSPLSRIPQATSSSLFFSPSHNSLPHLRPTTSFSHITASTNHHTTPPKQLHEPPLHPPSFSTTTSAPTQKQLHNPTHSPLHSQFLVTPQTTLSSTQQLHHAALLPRNTHSQQRAPHPHTAAHDQPISPHFFLSLLRLPHHNNHHPTASTIVLLKQHSTTNNLPTTHGWNVLSFSIHGWNVLLLSTATAPPTSSLPPNGSNTPPPRHCCKLLLLSIVALPSSLPCTPLAATTCAILLHTAQCMLRHFLCASFALTSSELHLLHGSIKWLPSSPHWWQQVGAPNAAK